jgi:hypothetical protein
MTTETATAPASTPTITFICMTHGYWGRGATIKIAKEQCSKAGAGSLAKKPYIIYSSTDPEMFVNGMGDICSMKNSDLREVDRVRLPKR